MIVFNFFYNTLKVLEGMVRGLGKHIYSTVIMFIGYYIISGPIIMNRMNFPNANLQDIWFGHSVGGLVGVLIYFFLIFYYFDFD